MRQSLRKSQWGAAALLLLMGCGPPLDSGTAALFRVSDGEFFRGAIPSGAATSTVTALSQTRNIIHAGQQNKVIGGDVDTTARSVALALSGDRGYWLIPVGGPDVLAPGQLTFSTKGAFSPLLKAGSYLLNASASDEHGQFGAIKSVTLATEQLPAPPSATLLISLAWDSESDLDLHVVDANGAEIWARKINSYTPPSPGQPADPQAAASGGILDFDSNAQCVIDGRRVENVYWTTTPPSGHYLVRVDTFSLCGEPAAYWNIDVSLNGSPVVKTHGIGLDSDVRASHDAGAGVLAAQFDIP